MGGELVKRIGMDIALEAGRTEVPRREEKA
jgi:hypothetical protein